MRKRILAILLLPFAAAFAQIDEIGGIATSTLDLTGYSHIGGQAIASEGGGGIVLESTAISGTTSPADNCTVNLPSGIQVGDLLLITICTTGEFNTFTTPTGDGWSLVASNTFGANNAAAYIKVADGSEGATQSILKGGFSAWTASSARFSGVDQATPQDVPATTLANGSGNTDQYAPAITTTTDNAMVVWLGNWEADSSLSSALGPIVADSAQTTQCAISYAIKATAGTQASGLFDTTFYNRWAHFAVALRPAS